MAVTKAKKKDIKVVSGVLHVHTTSNNTLITLIDQEGILKDRTRIWIEGNWYRVQGNWYGKRRSL